MRCNIRIIGELYFLKIDNSELVSWADQRNGLAELKLFINVPLQLQTNTQFSLAAEPKCWGSFGSLQAVLN